MIFGWDANIVQLSEFHFGFSYQLTKDYNFNLVLVLITKSQKELLKVLLV